MEYVVVLGALAIAALALLRCTSVRGKSTGSAGCRPWALLERVE